jgi:hypothetical protein
MVERDAHAGHESLIAYSRTATRWCTKGALHEENGALLVAGGSWIPVVGNAAFRTTPTAAAPDVLAQADAFFGRHRRGYTVKVRDTGEDSDLQAACEAHGMAAFGDPIPQMICRSPLTPAPAGTDISLRVVHDDAGVADFAAVNTDAYATYGMPAEVFVEMFDLPEAILADSRARIVVAYSGTRPVATAMEFLDGDVACLQWVGTVAAARHMGLGRIVTEWATNSAFSRGARAVTLQASPMGAPLYARLGFETQYHYREYVRWEPPDT